MLEKNQCLFIIKSHCQDTELVKIHFVEHLEQKLRKELSKVACDQMGDKL